jgi:hypothetical protein
MTVIMTVYALIRPRFSSHAKTALVTAVLFLIILMVYLANITNLGVLPLKVSLISFIFNLIELPLAILIGAVTYEPKNEE